MKIVTGRFIGIVLSLLLITGSYAMASNLDLADDIRKEHIFGRSENIVGPGSVFIQTGLNDKDNILMSFGATVRVIPTAETAYDFGLEDKNIGADFAPAARTFGAYLQGLGTVPESTYGPLLETQPGWLLGQLPAGWFKRHLNEAGALNNSYIRNEDKLYFNAMPKDRKWSFYAALEFDAALDQASVDARGGRDSAYSNFGLERLHGTFELPAGMRFHAGWDIWHIDGFDGAGLVYGDDNPGFWVTGNYDTFAFNVGYFKKAENDWEGLTPTALGDVDAEKDQDRDFYAAMFDWYTQDKAQKVKAFYMYDRIHNAEAIDLLANLTRAAGVPGMGIQTGEKAETDSHHAGAYWVGKFGGLELMAEGVYQFGKAKNTGMKGQPLVGTADTIDYDDFDISAYAFSADASYEFKGKFTGFSFKPHLGMVYTSGDDDPTDDKLTGYNGVENAERYSKYWGGENTIIGDTNLVLGSMLYGYVPEFYGNGTPVFTGGVYANYGAGRGDNPGMTMYSLGLTMAPKIFLIYKTNVNMIYWNEDFAVTSFVDASTSTKVESGYAGAEWDNELTLALSRHHFIKGQASFFFPGDGVKDVTEALSAASTPLAGRIAGEEADDTAMRFALEFIWHF